ncbi:hypothetical protein RR48_03091 [Papilio machaon]|uniref:Uncharacterized protein n=1 Tax=Papilio machaon TaxID=76193 RepID=A0A0N1IPE2_PAPMA|nr:hypothetical protein RR48_03091 [Papilio machaon]
MDSNKFPSTGIEFFEITNPPTRRKKIINATAPTVPLLLDLYVQAYSRLVMQRTFVSASAEVLFSIHVYALFTIKKVINKLQMGYEFKFVKQVSASSNSLLPSKKEQEV